MDYLAFEAASGMQAELLGEESSEFLLGLPMPHLPVPANIVTKPGRAPLPRISLSLMDQSPLENGQVFPARKLTFAMFT